MSEPEVKPDQPSDNACLDEMTLLLYAERQLDREAAQSVSLHTQTCARCLTLLRALDRESRLLTRSMLEQDEPLPARLAEFHTQVKHNMQWIWGVVFGLSVLGVYALYTEYIEPWQNQLKEAGFGSSNLLSLMVFQGVLWKGWASMFGLIQVLAVMIMAGFGLFAVRRYLRRGSAMAVVLSGLGVLLAVPSPAAATEFRKNDTVTIRKGEVIKGDLFVTGNHVRIEGEVDGDVYAFAEQLEVSGRINGDLLGAIQAARISGVVDGNVRAAAHNVTITGTVERNVLAWNDSFNLDSGGKIGGSLTVGGDSIELDGKIGRDLLGFFKNCTISGFIGGSVRARGEMLSINSGAEIDGKTRFDGHKEPSVSADAKLASPLEFTKAEHKRAERTGGYYLWRLIFTGTFLAFGLVLAGLMPKFAVETVESAGQVGVSFVLGVLVTCGVLIASLLACATIVGLFVGVSSLMLWLVMLMAAEVVVGAIVGQWIMGRNDEFWPLFLRMVVGVIVVRVVTSVPVLGVWAWLAVAFWGMGAISLALYRRLQPTLAPNIPPAPMPPLSTPLPPNTTVGGL